MEADRLEDAKETDARYHLAKMFGQAMTEEGWNVVRDEHDQWRNSLLGSPSPAAPALSPDEHRALALDIEQRLRAAGVMKH